MQPLASAEELVDYSNGAVGLGDPRLDSILDGISNLIRRYCGWHITPQQAETVVLDGPGGPLLALPSLNVSDVTSITENETSITDYRWSKNGSVRRTAGRWSSDYRSLTVAFSHGYSPDEVPEVRDIALAAALRELSSPTGATREQVGAVSMTWAVTAAGASGGVALLQNEKEALSPYRIEHP